MTEATDFIDKYKTTQKGLISYSTTELLELFSVNIINKISTCTECSEMNFVGNDASILFRYPAVCKAREGEVVVTDVCFRYLCSEGSDQKQ